MRVAALQRTNEQQAANIEQLYEANRELVKQMERKAARLAEGVCSTPEDVRFAQHHIPLWNSDVCSGNAVDR